MNSSTTTVRTAPAKSSPAQLANSVQGLVGRVAGIARSAGRVELADGLSGALSRHEANEVTVVIAGETSSGKSSLVNALLGQVGMSPVGTDVTTTVHLIFRQAASTFVRVHCAGKKPVEIAPEDISAWASVPGNPQNHKAVAVLEVGISHPLLADGMVLVDTPGAGGLEASHAEVTLAALQRADALVFVIDADAPFSRPELAFLERATERIATVIFVMTKTDAYHGWQQVLDANRRLLADAVGGVANAPFLALSTALEIQAEATDDEDLARELRAESGVEELRAALRRHVLQRAEWLRLANLVQTVRSALVALELPERAAYAAAVGDPQLKSALEAEQRRSQELARENAAWTLRLGDEMQDLRFSLSAVLTRSITSLRKHYEDRLRDWSPELRDQLPEDLSNDLRALMAHLDTGLEQGLADAVRRLVMSLGTDILPVGTHDAVASDALDILKPKTSTPKGADKTASTVTWLSTISPFFMGINLVGLGATLLPGAMLLPIGGVAGAVLVGILTKARRRTQHQQEAKTLTMATISEAGGTLKQELERRLAVAQRDIRDQIRAMFEQRAADVREALTRQQQLMESDRATRQAARASAQRRLKELADLRHEADRLLSALTVPDDKILPITAATEV